MTIQTLGDMSIADRIANLLADTSQPAAFLNSWRVLSPADQVKRMEALLGTTAEELTARIAKKSDATVGLSAAPMPEPKVPVGPDWSQMTLRQRVDNMLADNNLGGDRQMWLALTPDQQIARMAANLALASGKTSPAPVLVAG
ncbi:MAG: hypothetical protein WAO98_04895 [Alphaproteobacteria bacterium]